MQYDYIPQKCHYETPICLFEYFILLFSNLFL